MVSQILPNLVLVTLFVTICCNGAYAMAIEQKESQESGSRAQQTTQEVASITPTEVPKRVQGTTKPAAPRAVKAQRVLLFGNGFFPNVDHEKKNYTAVKSAPARRVGSLPNMFPVVHHNSRPGNKGNVGHNTAVKSAAAQRLEPFVPVAHHSRPSPMDTSERNKTAQDPAPARRIKLPFVPFVNHSESKPSHTCIDQCRVFSSLCDEGSKCVTIRTQTGCDMKCRNADGSDSDLKTQQATAPPTTLRPYSERRCQMSERECQHGKCSNGTHCACDRGYKGPTCAELECHFPCQQGLCYLASPRVSKCHCHPGWAGIHCNEPVCSKPCENGGACMWLEGSMTCTCESSWIGEHCEKRKPKASNTLVLVFGITVPVVCILILILSWYILWRKRVIFVFKIINMFKAYEDDDDKVYDAYVSLTESDTDYVFVKRVLQPRLEHMGHRLYLHARDGEAGVKSEEILKAVEKSRRCIMLLSADYISNEWCRFEYLLAQHETCIKLKQRIIPILMDDIDKDKKKMDKTLQFIVDSVKCLRYPAPPPELSDADGQLSPVDLETGHRKSKELVSFERRQARFWERLRLSMPKKREPFEVTSPTLSCDSECPLSEHVHFNKKGVRLFFDNVANLFPFGNSSQKSPSMGNFALSKQTSTCGQTQNTPPVAVISPSMVEDLKLESFYPCIAEGDGTGNKCENQPAEGTVTIPTKNSSNVKTLRLQISS